jgi:hypothetical protein
MVNMPFKVQRFSIEHMNYEFLSIGGCGVDPCRRFINQQFRYAGFTLKKRGVLRDKPDGAPREDTYVTLAAFLKTQYEAEGASGAGFRMRRKM